MGHFLGLDHSQINLDLFTNVNAFTNPCDIDGLAGMPLMFPFSFCQARKDAGLPVLSPDDLSWISSMYPNAAEAAAYGTITGAVFFPDGESQFQGANVIARQVDDPSTLEDESRRIAVSVVSGYLITGNPGQSITAVLGGSEDNTNGDPNGSRKPGLIGFYQVKVPPGTYTIEVETIDPSFTAGSGLGPLRVSVGVRSKFWNKDETEFDFPLERDSVTVGAGETISNIDIILNGTLPRFDANEHSSALIDAPFRLLSAGKEGGRA